MKAGTDERKLKRKLIGASVLLLLFAGVVMSVPDERLAWQAPLVMGMLSMPKPNPSKYIHRETRPSSDPMFSLLGFASVAGVLGLAGGWLLTKPSPRKITPKPVPPLVFP